MDTAIAPPTASQMSTDPVSSLRAAALSTLKAKRRKPPPVNLPIRPPPPTDTVHLDYGADDAPQDVLMKDAPPWPVTPPSPVEKSQLLPNHQAREEGEISEEDEPPAKSSVKTPLATVSSTPNAISPEPRREAERARQTPPLRKETTPIAKSVALPGSPQASLSAIPASSDIPMEGVILTDPPLVLSPLGLDSARPGLRLTQHQYDTLKYVILDLLGWGVPPAYLLDLGVSREAVFYVFSELNLALPEGFDTSDLIPYMPDLLPQPQLVTTMPPPSIPDTRGESKGKRSHPGQSTTKSSADTSLPLDLHDIERQRRQELMARKAAQASRRMRQSTSLSSSNGSSTTKEVLTMTPASATEAVDDFLNSIGPVVDLGVINRKKSVSSDDMDAQDTPTAVDAEPRVRRLSSSSGSRSTPSQDTTSTVDAVPITDGPILVENREVALMDIQPPPPSSSSSGFSQISDSDVIPTTPHMEHFHVRPRRGMKRAVATDFDFDAVPRKTGSAYPPAKQSKTAFVTIASRRCVIDLSDSETDDDPYHYATHTPGLDPLITKNDWKGKHGGNFSPNSGKPSTPSGIPPSALLQKEIEIQKMRELIARREEETRMKKLAAKPTFTAIDDIAGPNILQPQPIRLKVEETDVVIPVDYAEAELIARRSSESASPPGEISEASLPVTRSVTKSPIVKSSMQHFGDQDSASTRETQVQPELNTDPPPFMFSMVDVDMFPSSSAQMNNYPTITSALPKLDGRKPTLSEALVENQNHDDPQPIPEYNEYFSPFDRYPLLRNQSSISDFSSSLFMHSSSVAYNRHSSPARLASSWPSIGPTLVPDLKSLRLAVLSKRLNPSKRLCQYESGGGTCRDDECDDLHLSRLEASGLLDPTDEETADFLFSVLPHSWLSTYQVHSPDRILEALQEVHQQATNDLADKVATAMALIGSFPPPTSS